MQNITIIELLQGLANGTVENGDFYMDDTADNMIIIENKNMYFKYEDDHMIKLNQDHIIDLIDYGTLFSKY